MGNQESIYQYGTINQRQTPQYKIDFLETYQNYCVGIIDMVNSTKIAATLPQKKLSYYYEIFLNSMAGTIEKFDGYVIKNIGDSLLYYFPDSTTPTHKESFLNCLNCSTKMVSENKSLNKKILDFPVSGLNIEAPAALL